MDSVDHPPHYTAHPSGIECIEITEHFNFCLGNAFKYLYRRDYKHADPILDLNKAKWYIEREIKEAENGRMANLSRGYSIRSFFTRESKKKRDWAYPCAGENKERLHDTVVQHAREEACVKVCASHGNACMDRTYTRRERSVSYRWCQVKQFFKESMLRIPFEKHGKETKPSDRLQRGKEPSGEDNMGEGARNKTKARICESTKHYLWDIPIKHTKNTKQRELARKILSVVSCESENIACAMLHIYFAGLKGDAIEDLKKAAFYIAREIARRERKCG